MQIIIPLNEILSAATFPARAGNIARANITVNRTIAHAKQEFTCRNCNTRECHILLLELCFILFLSQMRHLTRFSNKELCILDTQIARGSHVQFKIIKSNRSCRQGCTRELTLLQQFLPGYGLHFQHGTKH